MYSVHLNFDQVCMKIIMQPQILMYNAMLYLCGHVHVDATQISASIVIRLGPSQFFRTSVIIIT